MSVLDSVRSRNARTTGIALAGMMIVAAVVRAFLAVGNQTARYFPDEYIYAALGRSLGHGHLEIRGATSHFPSILEPIVAAPVWRLLSATAAYHGVQVENAIVASLAAIPVYLLARWLDLDRRFAVFCAAYALVIPSLTLAAFTVADLVAYPLALAAVVAGVRSVDEPTGRRQIVFLVLASLATLARLEYAVLVIAYLVCAGAMERRRLLRAHRFAVLALLPAIAVGVIGMAGYYHHVFSIVHLDTSVVRWFFVQLLLLTLEAGVVMMPGAVAALARPHGRRETTFSWFVGTLALLLVAEASVYAASAGDFKERYIFLLLPLAAVAFGSYLKDRRPPLRLLVIALAAVVVIAAARAPISTYTAAAGNREVDSEFLFGVSWLESHLGTGNGSLVVAILATVGALGAVAVAFWRLTLVALGFTFAVALVATGFATHLDRRAGSQLRALLPRDLTWVDDDAHGRVTAIATEHQPSGSLREALYWNPSIEREVVLPGAAATDSFAAPTLRIGRDGSLANVAGAFLFDGNGTTALFTSARRVRNETGLTLWEPEGTPHLRVLVTPRYADGWLAATGTISAWPLAAGNGVRLSFVASLPAAWPKTVELTLGHNRFSVRPGGELAISCRSGSGPLALHYSTRNATVDKLLQLVSVDLSSPVAADARQTPGGTACGPAGG